MELESADRSNLYRQLDEQRAIWLHGGEMVSIVAEKEIDNLLECLHALNVLDGTVKVESV